MDIKSVEARSKNMSKIKSRNTKPEIALRSALHNRSYRFRVNYSAIEGHPDIYFTKKMVAIFIHGCYWHRHEGCQYAYTPKSNTEFWISKFDSNIRRDQSIKAVLLEKGIRVLIVWECSIEKMLKNVDNHKQTLLLIEQFINDTTQSYCEI